MSDNTTPFFVGYLAVPKGLRYFLSVVIVGFVAVFALTGLITGAAQDDPGDSGFRFDYGRQTVTGVMELTPYPLLRITVGNDLMDPGHTLMLVATNKSGVDDRAAPFEGQLVSVTGIILQRGTIDMLQLINGPQGMVGVEGDAPVQETVPLGRWSLAGEICDGKCLAGAMRPGRGLAHRACANLCLIEDVPPVFVSSQPVDGSEFMMITGPDGTRLPQEAYDYIGLYVELEGEVERRGDLLVLQIDPETIEMVE
jgi:hypothetical protein